MLIDKRNAPEIDEVVTIKLSSGEEVIGRLVDRTAETVLLGKPVQIVMQPVNAKEMGLAFHPVLGSIGEQTNVSFSLATLSIRPVKTNSDVTQSYIRATTSLLTPKANQSSILTS